MIPYWSSDCWLSEVTMTIVTWLMRGYIAPQCIICYGLMHFGMVFWPSVSEINEVIDCYQQELITKYLYHFSTIFRTIKMFGNCIFKNLKYWYGNIKISFKFGIAGSKIQSYNTYSPINRLCGVGTPMSLSTCMFISLLTFYGPS